MAEFAGPQETPSVIRGKPDPRLIEILRPVHMEPPPGRLEEPHQLVDIKNHSLQEHLVTDRRMHQVSILPGQERKDVDMLVCDIKYFLERRRPRVDEYGRSLPIHPLEFTNIRDTHDGRPVVESSQEHRRQQK